jgi:hypothetical protein
MADNGPSFITLDPTYEAFTRPRDRVDARAIAPPPRSLQGLRVGLLANGKANSLDLLEALCDVLARQPGVSVASTVPVVKGSVSVPPLPEDMARLVGETDVVLTAIGD